MKKLFLLFAIAGFFVACAPKAAEATEEVAGDAVEAVEEALEDAEDTAEVVVEEVVVEDAE